MATMAARGQVAQEDEEDQDHESHADQQIVQDVVGRDVDELGALVEDADPHARRQQLLFVDLLASFP